MEQWREDVLIHYGVKGMKWGNHLRSAYDRFRLNAIARRRRLGPDYERSARAYESAARRHTAVKNDYGYNKDTGFHTERAPKISAAGYNKDNPRYRLAKAANARQRQKSDARMDYQNKEEMRTRNAANNARDNLTEARVNDYISKTKYGRKEAAKQKAKKTVKSVLSKFGIN